MPQKLLSNGVATDKVFFLVFLGHLCVEVQALSKLPPFIPTKNRLSMPATPATPATPETLVVPSRNESQKVAEHRGQGLTPSPNHEEQPAGVNNPNGAPAHADYEGAASYELNEYSHLPSANGHRLTVEGEAIKNTTTPVATVATLVPPKVPPYQYVTDPAGAQAAVEALQKLPVVGLDIETTGLDPYTADIRLVQVAGQDAVFVFDIPSVGTQVLGPLLSGPPVKISHNAAFDARFLMKAGVPRPGPWFDTMLADQIIHNAQYGRSLEKLTKEVLEIDLDKSLQKSDWSGTLTQEQLSYAAGDAAVLLVIHEKQRVLLEKAGLGSVAALEMRLIPGIAAMQHAGMGFDAEAWAKLSKTAEGEAAALHAELTAIAVEALGPTDLFGGKSINWNSPVQVGKVLSELGIKVSSTNENTLRRVRDTHPIIGLLLEYREVKKKATTYGAKWATYVNSATGRIHADWRQIGSEPGRMSCQAPNLQNLPRDEEYRACFIPAPGYVRIAADYSQIELRIIAQLAKDSKMLGAFERGEDLHRLTASLVKGKPTQDVTKDDRQLAKAVNFGLIFGQGPKGLAEYAMNTYGVAMTVDQAADFREKFFDAYRGVRAWHSRHSADSETRTLLGRRRIMGPKALYTWRYNSPVQGTAADLLKLALCLLWETPGPEGTVVVQAVHDEIIVEAPEPQAAEAKAWLVSAMEKAAAAMLDRRVLPGVVEVK
jgi:DNA polymerase-1